MPASAKAARATGNRFRKCSRAANSGTTPPYSACNFTCDETTFARTTPSTTTAALVSSQELSIAKIRTANKQTSRTIKVKKSLTSTHGKTLSYCMRTTISTKGQIVLPAELREEDAISAGDNFEIKKLRRGEYLVKR